MAEQATERMMMRATPERLWSVVTDFDAYPEWAADLKEVTVVQRDHEGRPSMVRFRAGAFGRSAAYTLAYDHSGGPKTLSWKLVQGDIVSKLDGSYVFEAVGEETEVVYHLEVELRFPIPAFIKRRAEARIMNIALRELRARAESAA